MNLLNCHPLFLPRYKGSDKAEPLTISLVTACHRVSFWQSLRFGYWVVFGFVFVLLGVVAWCLNFPWLLFVPFWAFQGWDSTSSTKKAPVLPLPFLGKKSCCQAIPLATLHTDRLDWHRPVVDAQDDRALSWHFDVNCPNGIHRVDCVGQLLVYFADVVSLDGTPCHLDHNHKLAVYDKGDYFYLSLEQFCRLINERAYAFKKQCESDDDVN